MTRINTNVSSLIAQKSLQRSNAELEQSLQRLSTGLRINSGKDDPAGLIASEIFRSDIAATNVAISNCERANQMISTADSSLAEVSNLLIEIRSLVSEAANTGAMSADQIAANQLQVDSSLAAIDRIAQVTQFQGGRLLDGSLDFVTENVDSTLLSGVTVNQANFGDLSEISVTSEVVTQATQADLRYASNTVSDDLILKVAGNNGSTAFSFAAGTTVEDMAAAINMVSSALGVTAKVDSVVAAEDMKGTLGLTTAGSTETLSITAAAAGATQGNYAIKYSLNYAGGTSASVSTKTLTGGTKLLNVKLGATTYDNAKQKMTTVVGGIFSATTGVNLTMSAAKGGAAYNGLKVKLSVAFSAGTTKTRAFAGSIKTTGASSTWLVKITAVTSHTSKMAAGVFKAGFNALFGDFLKINTAGKSITAAGATTFSTITGGADGAIDANVHLDDIAAALNGIVGSPLTVTSSTGAAAVQPDILSQAAYYGQMNNTSQTVGTSTPNNYIQFVAPDGLANIEINFVTGDEAGDSLRLIKNPNTVTNGYSTAYYQGAAENTSFALTANTTGTEYDGTSIVFKQVNGLTGAAASWDKENKTITIAGDFATGVAAAAIETAVNKNVNLSSAFTFSDIGTGAGTITGDYSDSPTVATTDGGNVYASLSINLATTDGVVTTTAQDVIDLVNNDATLQGLGISAANAFHSNGTGLVAVGSTRFEAAGAEAVIGYSTATSTAANGTDAQITVTAKTLGDRYDNVKMVFQNDVTQGNEYLEYTNGELVFHVQSGTSTANDVVAAMTGANSLAAAKLFTVTAGGMGDAAVTTADSGYTAGGSSITPETNAGNTGGIHLIGNADAGDVIGSNGLDILSTGYGSSAFVSVDAVSQTSGTSVNFTTVDTNGNEVGRTTGTDADVRINGAEAVSDGLNISLSTATLDLSYRLSSSAVAGDKTTFRITGGGAQFQVGPDVVSTQQIRIGIQGVSSTLLGGAEGKMFQLQSGYSAALNTDTTLAASIVEEAITQVTSLRGRLGALQANTLETTIVTLTDAIENLTAAESSIRDTDFASESSALTRAQILVSSGISVLSIANQQPQNVLQLLQ